ncbi:septum site-determining protein MinC [Silanimonas sp.]|uniref:septum site-determining protein MinC n=1 Tax=Silanimonas sp. TaxID=1929290 RepID=UPI001BC3AFCE|nr:septum site-determining protein MinC [Silanimonas sp.]MBS3895708.1 septum site-determining protein MinC [Silanimonas sp.]MBS3924373.1 septum site-determining protein MinC [Xanthomonadaceae bacterium]
MAPTRPAALPDHEQAGELKFGQVGIANLRVRTLDVERLAAEMRDRVERAPKLFARAAVILDFGGLARLPDDATAKALARALEDAGVHPVALAYGTPENEALAERLGLPVLAKFRAQYERAAEALPTAAPEPVPQPSEPAAVSKASTSSEPGLVHALPVRSGQQLFGAQRDLTVLGMVGAGAEVAADGSIHVYGALRGRALAGASGFTGARIFCREFHAELVAVAGHYKVLDDVPKALHGKPVQVWLDADDILQIQPLA